MLSVISYNVMFNEEYFTQRHQALVALIKKNAADVVCLQEVLANIVDWLIKTLGDMYTAVLPKLEPAGRPYGELVFVKKDVHTLQATHPGPRVLSRHCIELGGKMGRALQHVQLEKDGVIYNVLTAHLESMNCKRIRREQLAKIWRHVAGLPHVICVGDTNQTATEEYTVPDNVLDAWKQTNGTVGEYTYYSCRFWDGDRKQRYDKAWYSNDLSLVGFGVLGNKPIAQGVWISDHDGLYCVFKKCR